MDVAAKVTSKGQITLPRQVREVLAVGAGDQVIFRIGPGGVRVAATADLISLAGSVPVPDAKRGTPWAEVLRKTRASRARTRR
jgi:antitoxin PrlF